VSTGSDNSTTTNNIADENSSKTESPQEDKSSSVAKIGTAVRDGKFEFIVKSLKCGETTISGSYSNEKAQGQFCRLMFDVKNIGDEGIGFSNSDQLLLSDAGSQYKESSAATIIVQDNDYYIYETINPGNSLTNVEIVYDVPADVTITKAELHDSAFSDGVEVNLQ
jgi:archaellum component FlaG (FlaF/FlaG flagellin family)